MATDVVTVWNLAISAAGGRGLISDETESSRSADLCRLWYPVVRNNVLKTASWPCNKKWVSLALLATRDFGDAWDAADPAPTWKYAYSAPSDMIAPRFLTTYARFERGLQEGKNAIFTNQATAVLHYLVKQTDVTLWDAGLDMAVVYALAANVCVPLNGKATNAERLLDQAREYILLAATDIANESDRVEETATSWIEARGYGEFPRGTTYIYPYEELNGLVT